MAWHHWLAPAKSLPLQSPQTCPALPRPTMPAAPAQQYQPLKPSEAGNGTIPNPSGTTKNDVQTTTWLKPCAEPFILYSTHNPGPQPRTPSRPAHTLPPPRKFRTQNSQPKRSRDAAVTTFERRFRCRSESKNHAADTSIQSRIHVGRRAKLACASIDSDNSDAARFVVAFDVSEPLLLVR